jgi:hypothetical protein
MELLVAVTLLAVIIAGLTMMFNETKRAFRRSANQVDVLDNGRAALGLLTQWLQEMAPSQASNVINFYTGPANLPVHYQLLPDGTNYRANVLQDLFVLTRANNHDLGISEWRAVKFAFDPYESWNLGVATLLLRTNVAPASDPALVASPPLVRAPATNGGFRRVMDGVVHLRVLAYDAAGHLVTNDPPSALVLTNAANPGVVAYELWSNALPAYVDVELGILEPQTLAQFNVFAETSLTNAANFLRNRAGRVHLFRQRVPIRSENRSLP